MSKQLFWNGKSDENWSNSLEWLKWVYFHYIKSKATNCTDLFADLAMDWLSVKIQTEEELELLVLLSKLLHSLYLKCTCFTCAEKISRIHLVDSALNTIFKFLIKDQTTKHRVCWTFLRIVPINNQKFDSFPKFIRGQPCSKHIVEVSGWSVKPTKKGLIRPWWYTCKIKLKSIQFDPPTTHPVLAADVHRERESESVRGKSSSSGRPGRLTTRTKFRRKHHRVQSKPQHTLQFLLTFFFLPSHGPTRPGNEFRRRKVESN